MDEEEERKKQKDDEIKKGWQKELDKQIYEKKMKNQMEKDRKCGKKRYFAKKKQ